MDNISKNKDDSSSQYFDACSNSKELDEIIESKLKKEKEKKNEEINNKSEIKNIYESPKPNSNKNINVINNNNKNINSTIYPSNLNKNIIISTQGQTNSATEKIQKNQIKRKVDIYAMNCVKKNLMSPIEENINSNELLNNININIIINKRKKLQNDLKHNDIHIKSRQKNFEINTNINNENENNNNENISLYSSVDKISSMSKNIEKPLNSKEKQILNFTNNKNSDFSLIEINKNMNKIFGNSTSESILKEKKKKKKLEKIPLLKINSISFQNILKDSLTLDDLRIKYNLRDIPVKRKEGFIPKNKYINTLIELQIFNFGDSPIWVMKISENGKYLAAGNKMGKIRIYEIMGYDYPNYENIYNNKNIMNYLYFINEKPIKEFSEHKKDITDLSWSKFKFNYLLSSSIDNYVILWDIIKKPNCKGKFKHDDYVTCIQFSPTDENIFITGCFNKSIRIYNINDIIKKSKDKLKETISKTPTKNYGDILIQDKITSMSFFPDGTQIAIGTFNGKIYVYDFNVNTGRYNHNFTCRNRVGKNSLGKKVTSITFLNKKNAIISTCDSSVRMISMLDGKNLSKYKGNVNENGMIRTDIDFSNDVIISGSEDGSCYTWKILAEEDKYLKNYNYESFKPFERDVVECSIIVNEECFINYMKKVLNFTNKINIISMFINSTDNGKIEVLLNINEDII